MKNYDPTEQGMTAEERYLNDPDFHTLVDLIYSWIVKHQYCATEVRDAAMLAAIKYEQNHVLPVWRREGKR